jgi:hypothetical protein
MLSGTRGHLDLPSRTPDDQTSPCNSSGVYMCKSVVNDLRHGNFICKSEVIYPLTAGCEFIERYPSRQSRVSIIEIRVVSFCNMHSHHGKTGIFPSRYLTKTSTTSSKVTGLSPHIVRRSDFVPSGDRKNECVFESSPNAGDLLSPLFQWSLHM